jgi:hypothetical protein
LQDRKLKDEIIQFVINSPIETSVKLATFIAGMQAQKNIKELRNKIEEIKPEIAEIGCEK